MKITDEMVETAAQALHHIDGTGTHPQWDLEWDYVKADYLLQARGALEAVAPLIAAQALRELATDFEGMHALFRYSENPTEGHPWEDFIDEPATWLRDRADQLEREAGQ